MNRRVLMRDVPSPAALRFPAYLVEGLAGTSFKREHLPSILEATKMRGFFEVHAENYMGAGGPPHRALDAIRRDYPVSLHGVCMSIGGPHPLDKAHLERFRRLVERYEPALVSEHLAWSTHETAYFNDLLPLPYTCGHACHRVRSHRRGAASHRPKDAARKSVDLRRLSRIDDERDRVHSLGRAQNRMRSAAGRQQRLCLRRESRLFGAEYLADFPLSEVGEVHLAGHSEQTDDEGDRLIIDSHDGPVADAVWKLYEIVTAKAGPLPTLVEWDSNIPEWPVLEAEAAAAQAILDRYAAPIILERSDAA